MSSRREVGWPLTPLQQVLLFQSLRSPDSGVGIIQGITVIPEAIDESVFQEAWQRIIARHSLLRVRFRWEGIDEPVQETVERLDVPVELVDWSDASSTDREERLARLLAEDRRRRLDLGSAPLMRLKLVKRGHDDYLMVWTLPHALIDGVGYAIVLRELSIVYSALCDAREVLLPKAGSFGTYVRWLRGRDQAASLAYWQRQLDGLRTTTPLPRDRDHVVMSGEGGPERRYEFLTMALSPALSLALHDFTAARKYTLNTLFQGAWALILSESSDRRDIVFGVARMCRPRELPDAMTIVGPLFNILPMRIKLPSTRSADEWLRRIRSTWTSMKPHEATPAARIRAQSELHPGEPLFGSVLTFEDPSIASPHLEGCAEWAKRVFHLNPTQETLILKVIDGVSIGLQLHYDPSLLGESSAVQILEKVEVFLRRLLQAPGASLSKIQSGRCSSGAKSNDVSSADEGWTAVLSEVESMSEGEAQQLLGKLRAQLRRI